MASVAPIIRRLAPQFGIDPRAAIAVALGEGGLVNREGDVGDLAGGGSYGPFQLYAKGALPRQYVGNVRAADNFAWSPQGIRYALGKMREAGAAGLRGPAAIEAIIRKFERPYDPDKSVAAALGRLGSIGGRSAAGSSLPPARALPTQGGVSAPATNQSTQGNPMLNHLVQGLSSGQNIHSLIRALPGVQASQPSFKNLPYQGSPGTPEGLRTLPMRPNVNPGFRELGRATGGFGAPVELIHDPMKQAIFDGVVKPGAYGGHGGHVHYASKTAQEMLRAINLARQLGLSVRENPYTDPVDPVHTKRSHHYQLFPGKYNGRQLGRAADISGDPQKMKALYQRLAGMK